MYEHAWTRIPHYSFNLELHVGLVAMNNAFATGAFLVLEGAFVKPQKCIFFEFAALGAELPVGAMVIFAVYVYHVTDCLLFPSHSLVCRIMGLRLHIDHLK